jgi:ribosome-associated translation inhibitor RaiA
MNLLRKERDWSKKKVDVHRQEQQEIKRLKREGKTESITARIDEIAKEIQNQDPSKKCICCHKEIDDNGSSVEMSFTWGSSHDGDLMKGFICDSCEEMAQKYIDKTIGDDQPKYCLCCKKKIKVDRELLGDGKVQSNLEGGVVRISIKDVWPYRICDPCADEAEKYCKIEDWMSPEMNYDTTGHVTKKELTQLLKKRNITSRLDKVAEELEQAGRPDIALALDKVSDQLEKQATVQDFLNKIKDMFKKEEIYNLPEQAKKKVIEEVQKILVPGKGWVPSRNIQGQLPMTKVMGLNREVQILKQFIRLKP